MLSDLDEDLALGPCIASCNLNRSKSLGSLLTNPENKLSNLKKRGSFREPKAPKSSFKSSIPGIKKSGTNSNPSSNSLKHTNNLENIPAKNFHNRVGDSKTASHNRLPLRNLNERWVSNTRSSTVRQSILHREVQVPKLRKPVALNACDLGDQLRSLSNEHGKLMVKHTMLRMQLIESISLDRLSQLRTDHHPDMQLFSKPENYNTDAVLNQDEKAVEAQKLLVQNLETENFRLQMENRKLLKLKKFCEKILDSESPANELDSPTSQQEIILLEKLQNKENDFLNINKKVQELENKLAKANSELKECQDKLLIKQKCVDDLQYERDDLSKNLLQCESALKSASENIDFLHIERATMAESLQETEQSRLATKAELLKEQEKSKHITHYYRKLCDKMKEKDLSVQLLQAELDRAEAIRQDILLNHSAERSTIFAELSQLSKIAQSILASTSQFALEELSIEKDLFEKILTKFDNEVNSGSRHNLEAISDSNSRRNSVENMNNGELYDVNSSNKESSPITHSAFKPIGRANPFRPLKQQNMGADNTLTEFYNTEDLKKVSIKNELNELTLLVRKFEAVTKFVQKKFISEIKSVNKEKNDYAEELRLFKYKHYELKADFDIRKHIIQKGNCKIAELSEELRKLKKDNEEEREKLLQKIFKLNEEVCCLEAIKAEQSQQISNEVKQMINVVAQSNNEFAFAQALSDTLNYKQEIAKLKALITEKERMLHQLAQKFERTTASLEENWHDAEKEVNILDEVIQETYIILKRNPELVEDHKPLKELLSLVSGKCSLSDVDSLLNPKEVGLST